MSKTLGGSIIIYNAIAQDYPLKEAVDCLRAFCDQVVVLDAGSLDGTVDLVKSLEDEKTKVVLCSNAEWYKQRGREKLSFFTNLATSFLTTDYYFNLQADECVHESCFPEIRKAIETGAEGFLVSRINLWGNSQLQLNVPHERSPVGTQIIRLAKMGYQSIDDAESIACRHPSTEWMDKIRIYHVGFVRNDKKHLTKIKHIQDEVFEIEHDKRIDGMERFNPWAFFSREDVIPIKEPLPVFIQEWAVERDKINAQ